MIDYRNILRLYNEGHSQRAMERELYCSRHTISNVLDKAKKAGISWPLGDDVTNEMIQELLFPGQYVLACPYTQPDFPEIHKELAKKGVTLTLLWEEYCVKVRASDGIISTWITASLRDRKFFTISEAKQAVSEKLEELNRRPFKKRPGCRLTAFKQEEKEFLKPLSLYTYEPSVWLHPKVGYDYLVSDGINKYSVPFDLIGEKIDVRLTKHIVEVFYKQTKVAAHVRLDKPQRDPVVKPEHMPEAHRRYLGYNADEFTVWANSAGSNIAQTVQYFLNSGKEAEQGFKSCASLMKLEKRYGSKRLDDACERVLRLTSQPTVRNISVLCKSSAEKQQSSAPVKKEGGHGITRVAAYYNKGGKRDE